MKNKYSKIIKLSLESRKKSYAPYSNFYVGAALITDKGEIYAGANIECESYSLTICAERTTFAKAISEGKKNIKAIAISTSINDYIYPCGACRQFMYEFNKNLDIILVKSIDDYKIIKLKELLPNVFSLKNDE